MLSFQYGKDFKEETFYKRFKEILYSSGNRLDYLIYLKESTIIGYLALTRIDFINGSAEIGTLIDEKYILVGFGSIAMALACDLCFQELNLNKIYFKIREDNHFIPKRENNKMIRQVPVDGIIQSYYYDEITKDDFFKIEKTIFP